VAPVKPCSTYQRQVISVCTFHIYLPNLVKFYLRLMLLTYVSFEKIFAVKSLLFLWQYLETIVTRVQARETAWRFASKECLVRPMCAASRTVQSTVLFAWNSVLSGNAQNSDFWDTHWYYCFCNFLLFCFSLHCKDFLDKGHKKKFSFDYFGARPSASYHRYSKFIFLLLLISSEDKRRSLEIF
jgi:hypothetical protein